jgi:hypothetical protein
VAANIAKFAKEKMYFAKKLLIVFLPKNKTQ